MYTNCIKSGHETFRNSQTYEYVCLIKLTYCDVSATLNNVYIK